MSSLSARCESTKMVCALVSDIVPYLGIAAIPEYYVPVEYSLNTICVAFSSTHIMCKHIPNAQVSFRAPCCNRWFDCSECHFELSDHRQQAAAEIAFVCKQCRKPFRKDLMAFEEEDESCPHCGNELIQPVGDVSDSRAATPAIMSPVTSSS